MVLYQVQRDLVLISEDHPSIWRQVSQWVRDRVEADFTACAQRTVDLTSGCTSNGGDSAGVVLKCMII